MKNKRFQPAAELSERGIIERNYNSARINLLLVVVATLINVILAVTSSDTYFLFTATVPYLLAYLSMYLCGMYPPEYYEGDLALIEPWPSEVLVVALVIAFVIIALYALSFFMSRKGRVGWLIFALVLFVIDTLALLLYFGISFDMLLDYVFHGWILVILINGIRNHYKLRSLPEEPAEVAVTEDGEAISEESVVDESSAPLRIADMNVKNRVLLRAEANGKEILYRKVKKTNELVIGGYVYDEYVAMMEMPHTLSAVIDGHTIEAGMLQSSQSFIAVDGELIAKKIRLI